MILSSFRQYNAKAKGIKYIQGDPKRLFACALDNERNGPENGQINFHISKKKGVLSYNEKYKLCGPEET